MSISSVGAIARGYSASMDQTAVKLGDKSIMEDPVRLAKFQQDMFYAQAGYNLSARVMQDLHNEHRVLGELLRDA